MAEIDKQQTLPPGFQVLEPFAARWAAATTIERDRCRTNSTSEERQVFFNAAAPLLAEAMAYLDSKALAGLDAADKRLLNLMMSLSHVQMAVEVHREMEPKHASLRQAMIVTRSATDLL